MKDKLKKWFVMLKPYKGILLFVFLLFLFHFSWIIIFDGDGGDRSEIILNIKESLNIAVEGDIHGDRMYFFGKDITPEWFDSVDLWLTSVSAWFIRLIPDYRDVIKNGIYLYFPDGKNAIEIIWGCTGIKQMFIFSMIMLFYWGPFLKKLWYIPSGCFILTIYNVIRISMITILTRYHPEQFESLHNGIFRYIYYIIVFILWVIWAEFIDKNRHGKRQNKNTSA
jgi:exosortase/archaeosortase family protein